MIKELEALNSMFSRTIVNSHEEYTQHIKDKNIIRQALKRNEPMKLGERNKCPNCNTTLNMFERANYCMHCGQKLEWSENE